MINLQDSYLAEPTIPKLEDAVIAIIPKLDNAIARWTTLHTRRTAPRETHLFGSHVGLHLAVLNL